MKIAAETPERTSALPYRADIDGLRAVAILVVVLYHAGVRGFGGGFVGVDVFFVISGWLITQQLLGRSVGSRHVGLIDFWGRRIRRLIPAAFCMVVGTTILSWLFLSPLDWRLIVQRGVASTLYFSNLLFAWRAGDYFSGPLKDSPYLHTWSLGVEEQFYLVWPLVFVTALALAHRRVPAFRRWLLGAMGAIFVISMVINLRQTAADSPWAFFGLPARAWEFAIAGIIAASVPPRAVVPRRLTGLVACAGLLMIVVAVLRFDGTTPFPGTAAILPVVGALLVLLAGHHVDSPAIPTRTLSTTPFVTLGLLSYSWYLWHWPLMTIAVQALYRDTVSIRFVAAIAALGVAALSYRFVENPIRKSPRLRRSPALTYGLGALLTVGALVISGAFYGYWRHEIRREPYRTYDLVRQSYQVNGCVIRTSTEGASYCESGARDSDRTVMLIGDSHAQQWMQAFGDVAADLGVRMVLRHAGNCSSTPVQRATATLSREERRRGCDGFQEQTQNLIDEIHPDVIVLADADGTKERMFTGSARQWRAAVATQVEHLRDQGIAVGLVADSPQSNDPLLCLARGLSRGRCTPKLVSARRLTDRYGPAITHLEEQSALPVLDVNGDICDEQGCRIQVGDTWIFAAFEHLSQAFTVSQEPQIRVFLERLLA